MHCGPDTVLSLRLSGVPLRCPPGHGDIYPSLLGSGMLNRLVEAGIEYVFVSNSDNLGATLDLDLLAYFAETGKSFIMEVCAETLLYLSQALPSEHLCPFFQCMSLVRQHQVQ